MTIQAPTIAVLLFVKLTAALEHSAVVGASVSSSIGSVTKT
jgi:hypothetical protein